MQKNNLGSRKLSFVQTTDKSDYNLSVVYNLAITHGNDGSCSVHDNDY